jgi:hypothetical protein
MRTPVLAALSSWMARAGRKSPLVHARLLARGACQMDAAAAGRQGRGTGICDTLSHTKTRQILKKQPAASSEEDLVHGRDKLQFYRANGRSAQSITVTPR